MPEQNFRFFSNRACAYFPCHKRANAENFNCLFCWCPLYHIRNCGGNFRVTKKGIKDCGSCLYPHLAENYEAVVKKVYAAVVKSPVSQKP